jgi:hypothetical protein
LLLSVGRGAPMTSDLDVISAPSLSVLNRNFCSVFDFVVVRGIHFGCRLHSHSPIHSAIIGWLLIVALSVITPFISFHLRCFSFSWGIFLAKRRLKQSTNSPRCFARLPRK